MPTKPALGVSTNVQYGRHVKSQLQLSSMAYLQWQRLHGTRDPGLRDLPHRPRLTNYRFGLPAPPIIMVKALLRSGPPLCDLENTHFRSPFWRHIGFTQTKSGPSLLTFWGLAWRGAMGQFNVGEVVTCIPMISRSAAPGDYKIVGEMPERDGDRMYRIKSPLEEHERVVGESLLVRSEGHLPDGAMARRSARGEDR